MSNSLQFKSLISCRWIVGQKYDLFFFIGSCVFTLLFFGIYQIAHSFHFFLQGDSILITYCLFTALFDQPHIFQTFSRTHWDQSEFQKRQALHTWGLAGFILIGLGINTLGWESQLIVFAALFGSYHIVRQHYGFLRAYKGINSDTRPIDNILDYGTFYLGMLACLFNDYTDFENPLIIYKDLKCDFPIIPELIPNLIWKLFIIFLGVFFLRQIWRLFNGLPLNLPKLLLLTTALSTHYFVFFATATPFLVAEALETVYHDIQYQGWMMHFQRNRYPKIQQVALKWLGAALLYGLVVGAIETFSLMQRGWALWLFVPFTMIVLYHYSVDGLIWRFSQDPQLRQILFPQSPLKTSLQQISMEAGMQ